MRTSWLSLWSLAGLALTLVVLTGCGGGHSASSGGRTGAVQIRVRWPAEVTRSLPANTAGLRAVLTMLDQPSFPPISQWAARDPGADSTVFTFFGVPEGRARLMVYAYATNVEGDASARLLVAVGEVLLNIVAGQTLSTEVPITPVEQVGAISGRVTDASGLPLQGVVVTTTDGQNTWTAITDANGDYTLAGVPAGQRVVTFARDGWSTTFEQMVVANTPLQLDVTLSPGGAAAPLPIVQVNPPQVDQAAGTAYLTGTATNAAAAILIVNGNETLLTLYSGGTFSTTVVLEIGQNVIQVRATNSAGTVISEPIVVNFAPTGDIFFRVTLHWDGAGDMDLHTWDPNLQHSAYYNKTIPTGFLDVDNTSADGPENFTCTTLTPGRYRVGVNAYSMYGSRLVTVLVTIYHGTNAGQRYAFGPYELTVSNGNGGYPITGNTASWWRPCDVVVSGDTIVAADPDDTPLQSGSAGQAAVRSRLKR